ncbi:MAG: hypothetical protein K0R05_1555 [Anaerocolumna sp.]|nr:hypothetical protein [Anaerocolumna sp.]
MKSQIEIKESIRNQKGFKLMTEEINNLNTDFKELFVENKLEELTERLDSTEKETVLTITNHNYGIIKGYLDTEKFDLLRQYVRFVAFSSFLCEYAGNKQLVDASVYQSMEDSFKNILEYIQKSRENN